MAGENAKSVTDALCVACALCCDGTIFRDVKLRAGDDMSLPARLRLPAGKTSKLPQPCPALDRCLCRVYGERPAYCRQFECALFKDVLAGLRSVRKAQQLIRAARKQAGEVRRLLRLLGCADETMPLAARFRNLNARVCRAPLSKEAAALFGSLTLAAHDLNVMVSEHFYPGQRQDPEE
jgi:Fe-S-cluster containining protein